MVDMLLTRSGAMMVMIVFIEATELYFGKMNAHFKA